MASGILNNPNREEDITATLNTADFTIPSWGAINAKRIGNTVYLRIQGFKANNATASGSYKTIVTLSGIQSKANVISPILTNSGGVEGRGFIEEGSSSVNVTSYTDTSVYRYLCFAFPI